MEELVNNGIQVKIKYFGFTGPQRVVMRIFYLFFVSYLLLYRLILFVVIFFILKNVVRKFREITFVKKEESRNIYTKFPARNKIDKKLPLIIFSAHYDSFSSIIPNRFQKVLFLIFRILIIPNFMSAVLILILVILNVYDQVLFLTVIFSSICQIMLIIFTVFLVIDVEKSSGSIDNASGVSILLELAKVLANNPLNNIDVLILWPGAEEWGNKGSKHFCKTQYNKLTKKYDLDNSYNINIDMVGSYIGLIDKFGIFRKKSMNKNLNKIIVQSSKELKIPLELYTKRFEVSSDHKSFQLFEKKTKGNFQVCCFHSDRDSKYIHSLKDTPDKCSAINLNGCLNICYETIQKLDSKFN